MPKKIQVKFLFRRQAALVLERYIDDVPYRVVVSEDKVKELGDGKVELSEFDFDTGIPFGLPFEDRLSSFSVDSAVLERELHKANIWTADDVLKNPRSVQGAVLAASRGSISEIASLAREFSNKE